MKTVLENGIEREYIQTVMRKDDWESIIDSLVNINGTVASRIVDTLQIGLERIKVIDDIPYDETDNELLLDLTIEKKEIKHSVIESRLSERTWFMIQQVMIEAQTFGRYTPHKATAFYKAFKEDKLDNRRLLERLKGNKHEDVWLDEEFGQNKVETAIPRDYWKLVAEELSYGRNYILRSHLAKELEEDKYSLENWRLSHIIR